jgi:hypothetical protein
LLTSILAVGLGSTPALRGDWKWSRRVGENMGESIAAGRAACRGRRRRKEGR